MLLYHHLDRMNLKHQVVQYYFPQQFDHLQHQLQEVDL